ncbi:MAG: hypothetical protein HZB11_01555 [Candidatus Yonathbacteria bacterium]|nr:hypothetical protein [Candidatus Yonathbacteria bacterium]
MVVNLIFISAILFFSILFVLGVHKDIRDRKRVEMLIKNTKVSNERLRTMEGQKMEFASIAVHQLRAPLAVIKGYASMILEGTFGAISDPARDAVEKLYKSSEKVVASVEDLLALSSSDRADFDQGAWMTDEPQNTANREGS